MQEKENNGFGRFYRQRGSGATWAAVALLVAFGVATLVLERSLKYDILAFYLFAICFLMLSWIMGEIARRFCLFAEEARHRHSRYEGSIKKALKASLDFQNPQLIALIVFLLFVGMYAFFFDIWNSYKAEFARLFLMNAIFIPIFVFLLGLRIPSRVEYSQVNETENKNLADGLAWGYYFGYLKIVLPELKTQINLTRDYRDKIEPKVYIIIPKNCHVFDEISNKHSDPRNVVKVVGNLEPLKKNRGGVQNRVYKHTVHSIKDEDTGKTYYCIMEYATPLMNLHDMQNDDNAGLSKEERDVQVNLFVAKLREILDNDRDCKKRYQLVVYGGGDQDIGKIMIRALRDSSLDFDKKE